MVLDSAYVGVLRMLHDRLRNGVPWALTGSTSFALQGVPVSPRDIDVQTDEAEAYEIERRFAASVLRPLTFASTERIRSHFGALRIGGVTVEIMGGVQKRPPRRDVGGSRRRHPAPPLRGDGGDVAARALAGLRVSGLHDPGQEEDRRHAV